MARKLDNEKLSSEVAKCIKSIGQNLINRADDISKDMESVASITIHSEIVKDRIINYNVAKNYALDTAIDYTVVFSGDE